LIRSPAYHFGGRSRSASASSSPSSSSDRRTRSNGAATSPHTSVIGTVARPQLLGEGLSGDATADDGDAEGEL
jgi:hypothetical protein